MSLITVFSVVGCTETEYLEETKEYGAYSYVWTASDDDVEHETGGLAIDDGWGAVLDTAHGNLCSVSTAKLSAPVYTAAARLLTNEKSSSNAVVAVLRVLDENGKELGRQNVRVCDFDAKLTYQDFTFTFPVETPTNATFEIYWPGTKYVRVSEFGIMSKNIDSLPDYSDVGATLLGVDIEEDSEITYSESNLYYFDLYDYMTTVALDSEQAYDIANLISTLQGLVNRDGQRLFVRFMQSNGFCSDTDSYWLNYLMQDGQFLSNKTLVTVKSPMTLLKLFSSYYNGFAAWDTEVPATVNAVATACGADDLLPVRYSSVRNSLYYYLKTSENFADKPITVDLGRVFTGEGKIYETEIDCTGSRKNDVYIWAKQKYLDTRKTNSHMMAYHVDAYASDTVFAAYSDLQNMYLSNRDYYIANKAFFFDLSVMQFEIPDDDPDQVDYDLDENDYTIDYATFKQIMYSQSSYAESVDASRPIDVGGFTPWHLKYTKYTNESASGEVACEWETVYQFSIFNAQINADAPGYTAMANASIYSKYPAKESYTQTASKTVKETLPSSSQQGANYIMFYMGDFDSSAWLNTAMIKIWNDGTRGTIPLCWPYSLDIAKRAPHVIDWMYSTATSNDYFVAGDNGTGYLNPEAFANAMSKDVYGDLDSWAAYNKKLYDKYDIDHTGFLITRRSMTSSDILKCYSKFCSGVATNCAYEGDKVDGITITTSFDYSSVTNLVNNFSKKSVGSPSSFSQVRFILRTPTDVLNVYKEITSSKYSEYNFKVVDPYTYYALLAQQNG